MCVAPRGAPSKTGLVGRAILPAAGFQPAQAASKGGCGQDWPPSKGPHHIWWPASHPALLHAHFVYNQIMNVEEHVDVAVSRIAAAIGEPARARMLYCLVDGHARTSTELATVADVSPSTASVHLNRLKTERLVKVFVQGKHRYYSLDGPNVAGGRAERSRRRLPWPVRAKYAEPAARRANLLRSHGGHAGRGAA